MTVRQGLLFVLAAAGTLRAECLRVVVRDPAGLMVAGAGVEAGAVRARTGDAGHAELCGLRAGRHPVTIQAAGFERIKVEAAAPGERIVTLVLAAHREAPLVVTGSPEPRAAEEVDRALTVIPVENALVPGSWLTDILKMSASVDVRERGVDGTQADVHIRGGGFGQTLVLVNGLRVNDPQSGHHSFDLPLPLETVERIEVLRGSGSTLYGSDAVGGAIHVITRRPEKPELRFSGGLGDYGWNRQAASGAVRTGAWRHHVGLARDFSTGFQPGRDFRNAAVAAESFAEHGFGSTTLLVAHNERPFGAYGFYGAFPSWEKTGTTLAAASQTLGRHRVQFSYRRHRDHYVLYRDQPEVFQNRHTAGTWNGAWSVRQPLGPKLTVTGGLEALSESIASTNLGDHRRGRASGFAVVEARPSARVTLTAGARQEVYRRWRAVTSPTVSASVRLGAGWKVRGSAGHAFRAPSYTELYYHDPANRGNPGLRPESAWSYEGGLDFQPGGTSSLSATWFERRERDTIDFVRPAGAPLWEAQNFQRLNFHGGEFEWRQRLRGAEAGVSYTLLRASRQLAPGVASRYAFNFPRSSFAASARAPLGRYLTARMRLGAFNRSWHSTVALWDVAVMTLRGPLRPFLQVTNLLDTRYQAFPGLAQPGRWVRGGVEWRLPSRR